MEYVKTVIIFVYLNVFAALCFKRKLDSSVLSIEFRNITLTEGLRQNAA